MPIQHNASLDEFDSPYFIANEKLCKEWETYILEKGGQINGRYNAWSFNLKTKVKMHHTWLIDIKKATYSSGSLLLSSKYQNLQEIITFKTKINNTDCRDFYISKSIFKRKQRKHPFYFKTIELLREEIDNRSLYEVMFKNAELTIIFHHKNKGFKMTDKILAFTWEN